MGKNDTVIKSEAQLNAEAAASVSAVVYGAVSFGIPAERRVSDRFNRTSVTMATFRVPTLYGWSILGAIYANLTRKSNGLSVEPSVYLPSKVIAIDCEGAREDLVSHIEAEALKWAGYDAAFDGASAALLNHAEPGAAKAAGAKVPAVSRLVSRLVSQTGAPVAEQRQVGAR